MMTFHPKFQHQTRPSGLCMELITTPCVNLAAWFDEVSTTTIAVLYLTNRLCQVNEWSLEPQDQTTPQSSWSSTPCAVAPPHSGVAK